MLVPSIAALRQMSGMVDGALCTVGGRDGGVFQFVVARENEDDGGTVHKGHVRVYSGPLDIRWFGASLAIDDNGPAINAAITVAKITGHEVWIPPGAWSVRTPVNLDRAQSVSIRGAGAGYQESPTEVFLGSWLRWTGGATTCVVSMDAAYACTLQRIGIEGAGIATAVLRLTSNLGSGFQNRVEDCYVRNAADVCIELGGASGCGDNLISHCRVHYAGRSCIRQTGIQTIGNRVCDRTSLYGWGRYALEFIGGDVHVDEVVMTDTNSALGTLGEKACCWIGKGVGPTISVTRFYAETFHDGIFFEPDAAPWSGIYSSSIRDSRFYVMAQDGRTVRMIHYPRIAPLALEANTYQTAVNGSVTSHNDFCGVGAGGHPQTAVSDRCSSYFNGAIPVVPSNGSVSYVSELVQNGQFANAAQIGLRGVTQVSV